LNKVNKFYVYKTRSTLIKQVDNAQASKKRISGKNPAGSYNSMTGDEHYSLNYNETMTPKSKKIINGSQKSRSSKEDAIIKD
jgi:hypothetical protein